MKLKKLSIGLLCALSLVAYAQDHAKPHKDDQSVHHAAVHAEHWLDHHVSAAHHAKPKHKKARYHKKSKSVHHAAMHAEHWIDHHVSAPHKKVGN